MLFLGIRSRMVKNRWIAFVKATIAIVQLKCVQSHLMSELTGGGDPPPLRGAYTHLRYQPYVLGRITLFGRTNSQMSNMINQCATGVESTLDKSKINGQLCMRLAEIFRDPSLA
jgi:hypothetical protein